MLRRVQTSQHKPTTGDTMSEKILDRVRKLLALANDDAATEGERDNALRMAHATLMKHNLSMEHLDAHERAKQDPRERLDTEGWNLVWCRDLRNIIAKLFFCKYYIGGRINATRGRHVYVGRASNVATAAYMSDWIIASVLKEADRLYKHRLTPEGRSFCVGVVYKLEERVLEINKATQAEVTATGSALVVADYYRTEQEANVLWVSENMTVVKAKARRNTDIDEDAYAAGQRFGGMIQLNQQVATTAESKRIK